MIAISIHKLEYTVGLYKPEVDNHICKVRKEIQKWLDNDCKKAKSKFPCLDIDKTRYLNFLNS